MISPTNWNNVPFRDATAWADFVGTHWLWHRAVAEHVRRTTGVSYRVYPIGDGGGSQWLYAVQRTYENAFAALGLSPPSDLSSYDLNDPEEFASYTFLLSQTASRLREAAGVN